MTTITPNTGLERSGRLAAAESGIIGMARMEDIVESADGCEAERAMKRLRPARGMFAGFLRPGALKNSACCDVVDATQASSERIKF